MYSTTNYDNKPIFYNKKYKIIMTCAISPYFPFLAMVWAAFLSTINSYIFFHYFHCLRVLYPFTNKMCYAPKKRPYLQLYVV